MEFLRFSLGLRFAVTEDARCTPEDCWRLVFAAIPPPMTKSMQIFGSDDDGAMAEAEKAYVCILSNASLTQAKAIYARMKEDYVLRSYLCAYEPFVQHNRLGRCRSVEFLGNVDEDGSLAGGAVSYAGMRFTGRQGASGRLPYPYAPRIFIAPTAVHGSPLSSADVARRLMRAATNRFPEAEIAVQRIVDGGAGTLDMLMEANSGRFLLTEGRGGVQPVRYGILPDRTVVLDTETLSVETQHATIAEIAGTGYSSFLLAAGDGPVPQVFPEGCRFTVLSQRPGAMQPANGNVECRSGIETVLTRCGFFRMAAEAKLVVTSTNALDDGCSRLGATADSVLYHCRERNIRTATLARRQDGMFCMKCDAEGVATLDTLDLDEACKAFFARITL